MTTALSAAGAILSTGISQVLNAALITLASITALLLTACGLLHATNTLAAAHGRRHRARQARTPTQPSNVIEIGDDTVEMIHRWDHDARAWTRIDEEITQWLKDGEQHG